MFCGNCGKTVEDGAKVCPYCGAPLGEAAAGSYKGGGSAPRRPAGGGYAGEGYARRASASRSFAGIGISTGLVAALIYWGGLLGNIGMVVSILIAGYVLIREKDEWLRAVALKGIVVLVIFGLLIGFVSLLGYTKDVVCDIINSVRMAVNAFGSNYVNYTNGGAFTYVLDILRTVLVFMRDLFLILCGFAAIRNRNLRIPVIDGIVNNNIGRI